MSTPHPFRFGVTLPGAVSRQEWIARVHKVEDPGRESACERIGSKREEWSDFGVTSDQSARSVSTAALPPWKPAPHLVHFHSTLEVAFLCLGLADHWNDSEELAMSLKEKRG